METLWNQVCGFRTICSLLAFLPLLAHSQQEASRIRFTTLSKSTPGGLKSDLVRDLTQDGGGMVWIATDRGLCRFDGWETVHYKHDPASPKSLSSDQLTSVATTRKTRGPVWIGTSSDGLMKFQKETGEAEWLKKGMTKSAQLLSDHIVDLEISEDKFLWIGTDAGLNVLNLATGNIVVADGPLGSTSISSVTALRESDLWVGTTAGELYHWNPNTKVFDKFWSISVPIPAIAIDLTNTLWIGTGGKGLYSYSADKGGEPQRHPVRENNINALSVDSKGGLWVGTTGGLALYDRGNDGFVYFNHTARNADSLTDDHVSAIFEDGSNMLWIATQGGGTSRFHLERHWFTHIRHNPDRSEGLPHSFVRALTVDPEGCLWLGTADGPALWDSETSDFRTLPLKGPDVETSINSLLLDRSGSLWMGTRGSGLLLRAKDGTIKSYHHDPADPSSLGHDHVSALLEDASGRIFVGTQGAGLLLHDAATGSFTPIKGESGAALDFISALSTDPAGNVWIAARSGIHLLAPDATVFRDLRSAFPNAEAPTSPHATTILPDSNGIVWIGTLDAGLDRFNTITGEIANFNSAIHGLSDDAVVSLVKDQNNLLWVATRNGIARLNAMQNEFRLFTEEDGLQRAGFNPGAVARDGRGRLYFGGQDGFNIIDPSRLPVMPRASNPILTSLEYFGEQVVPKEGGILEKEIAATDELRLPFDSRLRFALRFANLDYRFPNRGFFRYTLEGYDKEWIVAGEDRKAIYANLVPGKYEFKVQSSLDGRDWPKESSKVRIIVTPPWWRTWWFGALGLAAIASTIIGITKFSIQSRVKQLHRREEMLTAQRDKAEATLARQLQNRMLLERSYRNLHNETPDDQILSGALKQITDDFDATHCLVLRIVTHDLDGAEVSALKQIGYWNASDISTDLPTLAYGERLARQILASNSVLTVTKSNAIPDSIRIAFPDGTPITMLAAKTSFLDSANGIILLFRVADPKVWTDDDVKLLEAFTSQFGISIAQIQTAEIEEKYRTHLEEGRHHAEVANRAKSDFLAKMTHELRTPLNAVIGFSEILGEDKTLNPKQRETLDIINNSGEHLLDVINEILDLSKIEAGKMERHDETFEFLPLLKSVYEMLSMKAGEKRIGFNFSARTALPGEICTDRSKLRQILINLVGNAIKFTAQGAVGISVATEIDSEPELVEGRLRRRVRLIFEISDTGRGIHEEEIGKLFERYSQTESGRRSSEGTGLGLPIARSFVQMLGGDIEVSSVFGEGTVFRFSIECEELAPVVARAEVAGTSLDEKTAQRINGFTSSHGEVRILIAEDQPTNRLLLKRILGKAGFVLAEVGDGQAAVEKWSEWKPHLILMDQDMPVMKGNEATREIQSLATPDERPVIISLTAYALEQARVSAIEAGCSDFVAKPFRSHELFSVISKHLGLEYTFNDAA